MKAARDVASLSPAGGGLRGWNYLRRKSGRFIIWEVYNMNSHNFFFS